MGLIWFWVGGEEGGSANTISVATMEHEQRKKGLFTMFGMSGGGGIEQRAQ